MSSSAVSGDGYEVHTHETVHRAYEAVFQNLQSVVERAWLPFVLVLAVEIVGMAIGGGGEAGHLLSWMLGALAFLIFGTTFAVHWFRHLLLGEAASGELFPRAWRPLFFAALTITLLVFAGGIVVALIGMVTKPLAFLIWAVGSILVALAALRVLPMLPAAAVERPIDVRGAWEMLAGNYWHYIACALICYVPFALIEGLLAEADSGAGFVLWAIIEVIRIGVTFLGLACLYAMLADVYHGLTGIGRRPAVSAAA